MFIRFLEGTVVVIVFVAAVVLIIMVYGLLSGAIDLTPDNQPCWSSTDNTYQCRKYQIEQCLADERWDEATCIKITGGGK